MRSTPHDADHDLCSEVDVLVIGAGLAGLACANRLLATAPHLQTLIVERDHRVGGRVGTDLVNGFRCDHGFQLLNPAYPEVRRVLDLSALVLQPFPTGVAVAGAPDGSAPTLLGDPRRVPGALRGQVLRDTLLHAGSVREVTAAMGWVLSCTRSDAADLISRPDDTWFAELDARGVTGSLRQRVIEPFLAGVLGEADGSSSRRFVELLIRSFVRGRPSVPWQGMQAVPDQLAQALRPGSVRTGVSVTGLVPGDSGTTVHTDHGSITARRVVVATDPAEFTKLTQQAAPPVRPLTTFWHAAPNTFDAPAASGLIHVDGSRASAVVNSVVISSVARSYSPDDRALIATTVLGLPHHGDEDPRSESSVRQALSRIYRTSTNSWELVTTHAIDQALTAMLPPLNLRHSAVLADGLLVAGDHRDTASLQGALVSGRRAADAVLNTFGLPVPPRPPLDQYSGRRRPVATISYSPRS